MLWLDRIDGPPNRHGRTLITFWVNIQFCSETKWANGDVSRDSQREISLGRFGRFLRLFFDRGVHPDWPGEKWISASGKATALLARASVTADKYFSSLGTIIPPTCGGDIVDGVHFVKPPCTRSQGTGKSWVV